jgi:transcription antitermination protein NusB
MASKRHERTSARRVALQVLYTAEITNQTASEVIESGAFPSEEGPLSDYAVQLVRGVEGNRIAIDGSLKAAAENWSLGRMPIVDRSVLRLAVYEMRYVDDVPVSVAINEAVELAKDFGGEDDSSRFVNGVLGRIAKEIEADAASSAAAAADGRETPKLDDPAQPLV